MITTAEMAERVGLSTRQVRHLAEQHNIGQRVGGQWIFAEDDVDRFEVRRGRGRPAKEATK